MSTTARLLLPYIAPQQAQKQVTYNEAMAALDVLVQPSAKSRTIAAPAASPAQGDCYVVAPSATGAWAGKDGKFAVWRDGGWDFVTPGDGWLSYIEDSAEIAVCASGAWSPLVTNGGSGVAKFGINATADLTSRLTVAADASLFTHDGTDHRVKLNKASSTDTASVLFQTGFSGRAEFGLAGDDAFHLKVSPDGASWLEALTIDEGSGLVTLPSGRLGFPTTQNPSADAHTLDDYGEGVWTPSLQFGGAGTGVTYAAALGRYTKIGRLVVASAGLALTSKGSSTGDVQLLGLPFTSLNDGIGAGAAIGHAADFASVTGAVLARLPPNATSLDLYQSNGGAAVALTDANLGNSTTLTLTLSYDAT